MRIDHSNPAGCVLILILLSFLSGPVACFCELVGLIQGQSELEVLSFWNILGFVPPLKSKNRTNRNDQGNMDRKSCLGI